MLSSKQFTWDKFTKVGVADITDIFGQRKVANEFRVQSTKTGAIKTFKYHRMRMNREDECVALVFRSTGFKPVTIELVND